MQNTEFEVQDFILKLSQVKIPLEPITPSTWYEMKREQQTLPALSEANEQFCAFCLERFESTSTYAKCVDCTQCEVLICFECLQMGAESDLHKRGHRYILHDNIGPTFFDEDLDSWGVQEDLKLLNSFIRAHLDQWPEMSKDFGRIKSLTEALERLDRCFLRSEIGQSVLKGMNRGSVHTWGDILALASADKDQDMHCTITENKCCKEATLEETCPSNELNTSLISGESLPSPARKRKAFFDEEDHESDFDSDEERKKHYVNAGEISEQRLTARNAGDASTFTENRRATRKEQLLVAAKNAATAEAFRGQRKTSLELSEAINIDSNLSGRKDSKNVLCNGIFDDDNKLSELYTASSRNPYYYNTRVPLIDAQMVAKFDEEDLQLLTYLPFRDEFEHEYKNDAEQLISRIVFPREDADLGEVDKFLNEVIYARFNRYNRLMRIRTTKKAIIREHNLLNEYLNTVKTNISEKGKYSVFEGRYFNTRSKEDFYRPVFTQLRQVADKETINQLAQNIGEMEMLIDQINELKQLQQKGVTKLKGRLKVDSTPVQWSKKRKNKKSDSVEQRKAGLRWKRIKRWTKRNHSQLQTSEGNY